MSYVHENLRRLPPGGSAWRALRSSPRTGNEACGTLFDNAASCAPRLQSRCVRAVTIMLRGSLGGNAMGGTNKASAPHVSPTLRSVLWPSASLAYAIGLLYAITLDKVRQLEQSGGGSLYGWDKLLHATAFLVLGVLVTRSFASLEIRRTPFERSLLALLSAGVYAVMHEAVQLWIPGATFNVVDLAANVVGLAVGVGLASRWRWKPGRQI